MQFIQSPFWRRVMLRLLYMLALSLAAVCPGTALAGRQADSAVAAVKALIASGKVSEETSLRIVAKEGNINNFWGNHMAIKNQWEELTGIMLDARVRLNLPVLEYMRDNKDLDITLARQREYPDLYLEHLIADLTPYVKQYGFVIDETPRDGYFAPAAQTIFDNKIVAIPADGDVAVMFLRKDLLTDPANRAEFEKKYHKPLAIPQTWDEYQQLVEFFHRPEKGLFGTCEHRDPGTGWMFWMPRYASQAYPNQYLFDETMHPLIDSPAGVAATESYIRTVRFSHPQALEKGHHYNVSMPLFRNGKAFAYIITLAGAKMFNAKQSPIIDRFLACQMPGTMVDGRLVRRTSFIYGNNIVISAASPNKELAFLFAMWFTDPDISTQSIEVTSGIADPFRHNHAQNSALWPIYTRQTLELLPWYFESAVPAGTGLPGDTEYMDVLSEHIWLAAQGKLTAGQAMAQTAVKWEALTAKYGRESQIRYWNAFLKKYPQ